MGPRRTRSTLHGSALRVGDSRLRYARRRAVALSVLTHFDPFRVAACDTRCTILTASPPGLPSLSTSIWCSRSSSTPPDPSRSLIWPPGRFLDSMSSTSRAFLVGAWVVRHDRFISWIVRRLCGQFVCSTVSCRRAHSFQCGVIRMEWGMMEEGEGMP